MNIYQCIINDWMHLCFDEQMVLNKTERSNRFIEEALELVQTTGYTKEQVLKIVNYVFNRPTGELGQEVGGVMVTLAALCNVHQLDIEQEIMREYNRIDNRAVIDKIRAKQALKINENVAE